MNRYVLIEQLKRHEGFRAYAYHDSLGYLTIGYGRLIDRRKGGGITVDEATVLLSNDVNEVVKELWQALPWIEGLGDVRQRVLCDMAFNMGVPGLVKFTRTLDFIQRGEFGSAANQMLQSLWARQVPNRARTLAEMMRTGKDPV